MECIARAAVYLGLMMISPVPHLWANVHEVSRGNLSVMIFISTFVPAVQGMGGDVG